MRNGGARALAFQVKAVAADVELAIDVRPRVVVVADVRRLAVFGEDGLSFSATRDDSIPRAAPATAASAARPALDRDGALTMHYGQSKRLRDDDRSSTGDTGGRPGLCTEACTFPATGCPRASARRRELGGGAAVAAVGVRDPPAAGSPGE
jgi:hypothetical protein